MFKTPSITHAGARQNYLLRITTFGLIFLTHLSLFTGQDKGLAYWLVISVNGLLYPHLAYRLAKTIQVEERLLLWDAMGYGVHLALWGFNPYLVSLFCAAICITYLAVGGVRFCLLSSLFLVSGMTLGGSLNNWAFRPQLPLNTLVIVSTGYIVYMINLGILLFSTNAHLRKARQSLITQQDDLLIMNRLARAVNQSLNLDTIMEAIMEALQKRYSFESLYIVPRSEDKTGFVISGIYGSTISTQERDMFMKLKFDVETDKRSIFVKGLMQNRTIYVPRVNVEQTRLGAELDQQLYTIKPCRSIAYFPISVDNQVIAGAAFINYQQPFDLAPDDLQRIGEYLLHAGSSMRNLHLFNELTAAKNNAESARLHAEQSMEAKGRFLANMSHEIRTPLTAVLGYAEALLEKDLSEDDQEKFVQIILRSGQHLVAMINDILDIAKIEAGGIAIEILPVSLAPFLYNLISIVEFNAQQKNLAFQLRVDYPIPATVFTDPTRLNQILLNLLNNAIKFTQQGNICLQVGYQHGHLQLSVIDTGIGISQTQQFNLFTAFTQADSSTTRRFGGTGLGLFISQNLAQLMGGRIQLSSSPSEGSCFELQLPTQASEAWINSEPEFNNLWQSQAAIQQEENLPRLRGRLLIAEDNLENQQLLSRILDQLGLEYDLVNNGAQALVKALQGAYDLLIFDLQMPIMGGREAAEILLRHKMTTPILAFTANLMRYQTAEYLAIGFAGILEKPFTKRKVVQQLEQHLKRIPYYEKILLVDDDPINQMIIQQLIKKLQPDIEIVLAGNGQQAIERIADQHFDLILMDKQMPIMDGLEATQHLRANGNNTPIYVLSAHTAAEFLPQALAAGANGYLEKPIKRSEILALLGMQPQLTQPHQAAKNRKLMSDRHLAENSKPPVVTS